MNDIVSFPGRKRPPAVLNFISPAKPSLEDMRRLAALNRKSADQVALLAMVPPIPPRAILRRRAHEAYLRGIAAARRQQSNADAMVTIMPGRWARLSDRVVLWLDRNGRRDVLSAALLSAAAILTFAAAVSIAIGVHP